MQRFCCAKTTMKALEQLGPHFPFAFNFDALLCGGEGYARCAWGATHASELLK